MPSRYTNPGFLPEDLELHPELDNDPFARRPQRVFANTPQQRRQDRASQAQEDAADPPLATTRQVAAPPPARVAAPKIPAAQQPAVPPATLPDAYAPTFGDTEARRRAQAAQDYNDNRTDQLENDRQTQLRQAVHQVPVIERDPTTGAERPQLDSQGRVAFQAPPVTPNPAIAKEIQDDAYMARDVQTPSAMPQTRGQQQLQSKQANAMQEAEDKRAAGVARGLKAQGVEMITDLDGNVHPKKDDQGRTIYKPAVVSPFEDRGQGNMVSVHRDRFGNEVDVPLTPKIDKATGEKYVVSADGVTRMSLGVDQDYVLRKDAAESGKIAAQSRAELAGIKAQQTDLKQQIEDYGGKAAMIAAKKNPSDEDRAALKQLQTDRAAAVKQQDQLKEMHAAKSQETIEATQDYLDKRGLIIDKLKKKQEPPNFDTKLDPSQESQFQYWKKQMGVTDDGRDYDYRGAFKAGVQPSVDQHWPDTFKKPNHPTFSDDSQYAKFAPDQAGTWDDKGNFVPPAGVGMTNVAAQKALAGDPVAEKQLSSDPAYSTFKSGLLDRVRSNEITPEQAGKLNEDHLRELASQPQGARLPMSQQAAMSVSDPKAAAAAIREQISTPETTGAKIGRLGLEGAALGSNVAQKIKGFFYPLFGPNDEQRQHVYNSIIKDGPSEYGLIPSLQAYVSNASSVPNLIRSVALMSQGKDVTLDSIAQYKQQERQAVGLTHDPGDSKPWAVTKGVANSLLNAAETIVNPAFMSLPSSRVLSGMFGAQMLSDVPDSLQRIKSEPTLQGKIEAATQAAVDLLAGGYAARHAMDASAIGAASRRTWTGSAETADLVQEAIKTAKSKGVSPEFRSFFGGIDPEVAGTTPEKVAEFAKSMGMEWRPSPKVNPDEPPAGETPPPAGGAPVTPKPTEPQGPLSEADVTSTLDQLRGDAKTHVADLQGERDMLQSEVDDPTHNWPAGESRAAHLTRIDAIDKEISAVSALHPAQTKPEETTNEPGPEEQAAQRTDEPPATAPRASGAAADRPVPDKTEAELQDQPRKEEVPESQQGQGDAGKTERQQGDSLATDDGRRLLETEPGLAKTATKLLGLRYDGVHDGTHHSFSDPKTGSSVTVPFGTTPKDLVIKVKAAREQDAEPADNEITRFLADKDPTKQANEGGITNAAAVAMATKLVGQDELNKRAGVGQPVTAESKTSWEAARQILAEHKASSLSSTSDEAGKMNKPPATVDESAHEAATSPQNEKPIPSLAQHEADNAELGHDSISGMPISFENPAGSIRTNADMKQVEALASDKSQDQGTRVAATKAFAHHTAGDAPGLKRYLTEIQGRGTQITKGGKPWASKMLAHYGRFKGTVGKDGDHLDAYVKEGTPKDYTGNVYVINQKKQDGKFDEHKAMVGYSSQASAVAEYAKHYDIPAAKLIHSVAAMPWGAFKRWAKSGDMKKPAESTRIGQDAKLMQATVVRKVNKQTLAEGKWPNGKKLTDDDRARLQSENEAYDKVIEEAGGEFEFNKPKTPGNAPAIDHGRAKRFLTEAMSRGKAKATLDALNVELFHSPLSFEAKFTQTGDKIQYQLGRNEAHIDQMMAGKDDAEVREYVEKGLSEELVHLAQFEAVRQAWDGKGLLQDAFDREYAGVEAAMTPEERAAVQEAYGGPIEGRTLGAEFVRQLIQTGREGKPTEATIRAKSIIERILAVLKKLLDNAASWSEALKRAYDRTSAVLDAIEKQTSEVSEKPARLTTAEINAAFKKQKGQLTRAQNAKDWPAVIRAADEFEKFYEDRDIPVPDDWSRWQRAKEDAQLAMRRAEKPSLMNRPPPGGWTDADRVPDSQRRVPAEPKPQQTPAAPAEGQVAAAPATEAGPAASGASDELKQQAKKAFEGLFAPEPERTYFDENGVERYERLIRAAVKTPSGEIFVGYNHADAQDRAVANGQEYNAQEGFVSSTGDFYSRTDARKFFGASITEEAVNEDENPLSEAEEAGPWSVSLYAPEPEAQVSLPKDRRATFFDLADKMEAQGITTPEKVAAFLDEISGGKARKFTQALWALMESNGSVEPQRPDWPEVYSSLANRPNEANIQPEGTNERDTGSGNRHAGITGAGEADVSGESRPGGEISGGAVPSTELAGERSDTGPDAGLAGGIRPSGDAGKPADQSGGNLGGTETGDAAGGDRSVESARPDAGTGGAEVAGSGADRNHVIGPDDALAPKGAVAKLKANVSAVKLLKVLEKSNRNATPEEKQKLAQYTGWGQFKGAFDTIRADSSGSYHEDKAWNARWGATYDQLKKIMTPEEWNTAAESTLNAHYTAAPQIRAMWNIVERLGFKGGRVLEPAIGVGHFLGLMPQDIAANSKLFGLDMDKLSSRIAQKLYPQADIKTGKFEKAKLPNNYFDLTISNFPFHEQGPGDARYPKLNLHNYFFARAFDLTKPGGLVVAITSNSTLDNNPEQRAYLQSKADLVAAIRLPNNAFLENAGTEVTTDILIFRKPDGTPFKGESFQNTVQLGQQGDKPIVANEYFQRHPEMALGTHSLNGTQYAKDSYAMVADKYRPVGPALQEAIATLPKDLVNHAENFYDKQEDLGIVNAGEKEGSISFKGDQPIQVLGNEYKTPEWARPGFRSRMRDPKTRIAAAKSFVSLRDKMKELQAAELSPDAKDEQLDTLRAELNKLYDAHVAKFGNLEKGNLKFLEDDAEYYLVMGLEIVGKERRGDTFEKVITKADALSQRTLFPSIPPTSAKDVSDGAMVSMQYRGKIDIGYIAQLTGQDEETAQRDLLATGTVFKNPSTGLLETRDAYLASNVRMKLREAEAAVKDDPDFQKNVDELKAIQPERVSFENVRARAGSAWIPEHVYTKFAQKVLGKSAKVTYSKPLDRWSVELSGQDARLAENQTTYGTERATGVDNLTDVLNLKNPTITDQVEYITDAGNKAKRTVINKAETDKARDKARRLKSEFDDHARSDPDARQTIEDTYNDTFNSYVVPTFDGSHLVFPGMAASYKGKPITLRPHQKDVIYRITQTGGTLMAHGVGGGKTIAQIAAAMEMRRLGQARKPLIVVDKPTIGQFAATFRQIYPNANILVATQDSFSAQNRKRFMSRIATGNWDSVVMANSQFDLMPSDPQVVQAYIQTSIDQLREIAAEAAQAEGKGSPKVRQLQTEIKRFEAKMENVLSRLGKRQDDTIYFEQSGIDALFVDEAHAYKKVPFTTKMDPVKGIDRNPSQRAINLHPKIQFVQKNNRGRNVILATGTPVTNTLAEAWNMTRLVAPQLLQEWNVDTFDKFVSTFAQVEDSTEMNAAGRWVSVERLSKFTNGPELVKLIRTAWDVRMGEDLKGLNLPSIKGGKPETVALEVTPEQGIIKGFLDKVYDRFQALEGKERRAYSWIPAVTMQVGIAAATDPRLIIPTLPDNPNSVVNESIRRMMKIYRDNMASRATQIVFLDRFNPLNMEKMRAFAEGDVVDIDDLGDATLENADFNLYDDIRDKLVKAGVPRDEIAIANEHDTDAKRLKMQEDMQTGRIRFLIGGTSKIGQGINVQDKMIAMHHLDPPQHMTPAQYIQRNGRGVRDGNEHAEIEILLYGMKRTMAAGIWNRIETKAKFIVQILMGKGVGRDFEDPADEVTMSIAEQVAELTGDSRILRKVELEKAVRNLQQAREAHFNNVGSARSKLRREQAQLTDLQGRLLPNAKADKTFLEQNFGEGKPLVLKIGSQTFPDVAAFDEAFKAMLGAATEKGIAHFKNEKGYAVRYNISSEVNGLKLASEVTVYNPEKDYSNAFDVATHFSTPVTPSIESSNAKTGKGLTVVAKDVYEQRDKRIADREAQIQTAKDNIGKLEVEAGKVFTQGDELTSKETELSDLIRSLSATPTAADTVDGGSLTDTGTGLAAPEPSADEAKKSSLMSAFQELPMKERQVVTLKSQGKTDAEIVKATGLPSPLAVNNAYQIALKKLNRARTTGADVKAKFRQVQAEKVGERTQGRPELANPAQGPMSRQMVDTVDQLRKEAGVPGKHKDKDLAEEATRRLDKDYAGERRTLMKRASQGGGMFDDVETLMAKRIVAREALGAVKGNNQAKMLAAAKLIDAYRMTGTAQARAMRQRQDPTMSPEDRAAEYLSQALLTPDKPRRRQLEKTEDPAAREIIMSDWMRKLVTLKDRLAGMGLDIDNMTDEQLRNVLKDRTKVAAAVRAVNAAKADVWDKAYEFWINSVLSLPTTVGAKIVSDIAHGAWEFTAQRMTEALVNNARPIVGLEKDPLGAQFADFKHIAAGILPGLSRGAQNVMKSWRTELPVFEDEILGAGEEKSDFANLERGSIGGTTGRTVRLPLRTMLAADQMAKSLFGQIEAGVTANRIAGSEGLTGAAHTARVQELMDDMGSEAWHKGLDKGNELTFQTALGPIGKQVIKLRNMIPTGRYDVPFVRTISNIFTTGLRKSPAGFPLLVYRLARQGAVHAKWDTSGWSYSKNKATEHIAEQVLAMGVLFALIGWLGQKDDNDLPPLTGTVPYQGTKRGERDLAHRTAPPMSIHIGSKWYSYARVEPFAVAIGTMVDLINELSEVKDGKGWTSAIGATFTHLASQLKDKTFARGLGDMMNAVQDGEHAVDWATSFATSWIPNIVKGALRSADPDVRESKVWGREDWAKNFIDSAKYKALPYASDVIQPKIDLWGREIKKDAGISPATDWLWRMFVPIATQDAKAENVLPVDRAITNWNNAHPNSTFAPQPPDPFWEKKIDDSGKAKPVYMTREEYRELLEQSGADALGRIQIIGIDPAAPTQKDMDGISGALKKAHKETKERLWEQRLLRQAAA